MANDSHAIDTTIDFISGSVGAMASVYVGQPLDTVKVKMQTYSDLYPNAWYCFIETYKKQGIVHGLYAGTIPALVANIAENSILFAAYGLCQKLLVNVCLPSHNTTISSLQNSKTIISHNSLFVKNPNAKEATDKLSPLGNAISGGMAAIFSTFALCPTELIKCRLQAYHENLSLNGDEKSPHKSKPNIGPWYITKRIYIEEGGIRAFFKGLLPTFGREVPGYFFFFGGYEITRSLLTPPGKQKKDIGVLATILSGGVGGVCLWTSIFPFDVIKSRMQVLKDNNAFLPTLKYILKHQGIKGLYNGLGPTLLRTFPASGALFLMYEFTQHELKSLTNSFK